MSSREKQKTKDSVYQALRERLINCVYQPGSMLNELRLAEELGVSRTPIREAIGKLEMDGYVRVVPKKGIYVTDVTLKDVFQIFQTRIEIEPLALRLSLPHLKREELEVFRSQFAGDDPDLPHAFRVDTAMHLFLIDHCGNNYIIQMMHRLFDDNTRVVIATGQNQVKIHRAREEHLAILDALLSGADAEECAELMRRHLETCRHAAVSFFYSSQSSAALPSATDYLSSALHGVDGPFE